MSQTIRLGSFLVVTLAVIALAVFLIGSMQTRFTSTYTLKAQFPNVGGLTEGADVRVGGIRKGTVRAIHLPERPDGKITVVMALKPETRKILREDSLAKIRSEGLLGDKYVELTFGSDQGAPLKNDDTIASARPRNMGELVDKASQLMDTAKVATENLQAAAGNIKDIAIKVNEGRGTAGALINDRALYRQATAGVTALHEDAEALKHNFLLRGFFKKRGYEDASDIGRYEIERVPKGPVQQAFSFEAAKLFDSKDSAKLKHHPGLDAVAQYLASEPYSLAVIECSTGMTGDAAKNRQLSQARAFVIRKYLVDHYALDDTRIRTLGLGEEREQAEVNVNIYPARGVAKRAGG